MVMRSFTNQKCLLLVKKSPPCYFGFQKKSTLPPQLSLTELFFKNILPCSLKSACLFNGDRSDSGESNTSDHERLFFPMTCAFLIHTNYLYYHSAQYYILQSSYFEGKLRFLADFSKMLVIKVSK